MAGKNGRLAKLRRDVGGMVGIADGEGGDEASDERGGEKLDRSKTGEREDRDEKTGMRRQGKEKDRGAKE